MDLDTVMDELYGLLPSEFTAARDAEVKHARRLGDKELAGAIKALKRPTAGAWLANVLVRGRQGEVGRLLVLGAQLRQAQAGLAGDAIRSLAKPRQELIGALVQEAGRLATAAGQSVSSSALRELEVTLEAAVLDPDAADRLRAGRLAAGLEYSGFGLSGISSAPPTGVTPIRRAETAAKVTETTKPDNAREEADQRRRQLAAKQAEERRAEASLDSAEAQVETLERRAQEGQEEQKRRRGEMSELERQLEALRAEERTADDEAAVVEAELGEARKQVEHAREALRLSRA